VQQEELALLILKSLLNSSWRVNSQPQQAAGCPGLLSLCCLAPVYHFSSSDVEGRQAQPTTDRQAMMQVSLSCWCSAHVGVLMPVTAHLLNMSAQPVQVACRSAQPAHNMSAHKAQDIAQGMSAHILQDVSAQACTGMPAQPACEHQVTTGWLLQDGYQPNMFPVFACLPANKTKGPDSGFCAEGRCAWLQGQRTYHEQAQGVCTGMLW
jgi:hypothetical protein